MRSDSAISGYRCLLIARRDQAVAFLAAAFPASFSDPSRTTSRPERLGSAMEAINAGASRLWCN
jgi:hypothetical protein